MSLYDAECPNCGLVEVFTFKMVDGPIVDCNTCGTPSKKVFLKFPQIDTDCFETPGIGGSGPYFSKQLDTQFTSKKAYKAHLKANGMREISKGSSEGRAMVSRTKEAAAKVASHWGEDSGAGLQSLKNANPDAFKNAHHEQRTEAKREQVRNFTAVKESGKPKTLTHKDL